MENISKTIGAGLLSLILACYSGCAKKEQPFKTEEWKYEYSLEERNPDWNPLIYSNYIDFVPYHLPPKKFIEKSHFSKIKEKYIVEIIKGKITNVDEDSFAVGYTGFFSAAGTNFQLEFIRVKNDKGKERKFLIPQPFNYKAGDIIKENYIPLKKDISFKQITDRWDKMFISTQIGKLDNIEGIIIKDIGFCERYLRGGLPQPNTLDKLEKEGQVVNEGPNFRYILLRKTKIR